MASPLLVREASEEYYTYADYLTWDEGLRVELLDGEPVMMPSPSRRHQRVGGELFVQLHAFLRDKTCEVYQAPFDVRLFAKKGDRPRDVYTVVQPDILVVCDPEKLDDAGCKGVPDFIAELLSPSTRAYDRKRKFQMYRQAGVREYWIIDPVDKTLETFVLVEGKYEPRSQAVGGGKIPLAVLEGCVIDLDRVFAE